jgi:hypothetical protein|tara:strand:+ start:10699 stop:11832 length:1134 start_codon:yes stop_codon:yes gene_type:complete
MKITLKRTPEQIELVKAMASRNRTVAYEAQVALAEFIGPVLAEVINNAPTISNLFTSLQFNADDNPSIPLDLYYDINDEDYVKVYSQSHAGGLPTNQVLPTASELKVATYSLDTAVSFDRRYAAKSRMDVVSKTFTRVAQEILAKQETTSASLVMGSLADASTNSTKHVRAGSTATGGRFLLDDINKMMTLSKRINGSFLGGTPAAGQARGITDLIVSPEVVEELRSMAYNPINTKGSPAGGTASDGIAATDELRNAVYNSAGLPEFYGISIMEILELGVGKKFTSVFDAAAGSIDYGTNESGGVFAATDDIVVGLDRSRESLIRAVAVDSDNGGEFNLIADDQYSIRQQKIGYFGSLEEGRMVLDDRALVGTIVQG